MKRIEIDKEEFYDLFINKQLPIKDIALHFCVSTPVIERVRKELNLKRPRIYSMTMSLERFVEKCKNRYKDLYDYSELTLS